MIIHTLKLIVFISLLTLLSCGKTKDIQVIPEPPDYEPDSEVESVPCGDQTPSDVLKYYKEFISDMGGTYQDPANYSEDFDGLNQFLIDSGIEHFSAEEIATPGTPDVAANCNLTDLIPLKGNWVKAIALTLIYEDLRKIIDSPIRVVSWYRPRCYNDQIGGAINSDHISANAMDALYKSEELARRAQFELCHSYWIPEEGSILYKWNPLQLSIGLGNTMTHLGLFSDNGRRYWNYSNYTYEESIQDCWR